MNTAARPRAKRPWTKGEKSLLGVTFLGVALVVAALWWGRANRPFTVSVPSPPPMPARNAFDSLSAAARAEAQGQAVDMAGSRSSPYTPAQRAALIQANAPALRLLRQGLTLPYQNPPVRSFYPFYPYYADFRRLARLLGTEGQVREAQGDWVGAFDSDLDTIRLGEKIPRGGPLIGMVVGIACQAIGRKPAWPRVDHLSAAQARAAARRLEGMGASRLPLADVLQEEEWATQASLLEVFHHPTWRSDLWNQIRYNYADAPSPLADLGLAQLRLSSQGAILSRYTGSMNGFIRDARRPYAARAHPPFADPVTQALAVIPCDHVRFLDAVTQAENSLLLVSLALRAYRLDHGGCPPTLSALVPGYLSRVPADPFALSGPLRYKAQGATSLLYSVGPDGKDDGGRAISAGVGKPHFVQADSEGDIVAGVNVD